MFFGASLTWGANASDPNLTSYRALVGARLEKAYPKARFKFWDAAIGGTGSQLGVFRFERDVLRRKPDLVFLDFSANDDINSDDSDEEKDRSMAEERQQAVGKQASDFAIIPFGIPLLAGAGTISTVMGMIVGLTLTEYLMVLAAIVLNTWICYLFLAHSPRVLKRLGPIGSKVLTKLMGLILAAVAMQFLINGAKELSLELRAQPQVAASK